MVKAQDILLLVHAMTTDHSTLRQIDIAGEIGVSQAELIKIYDRLTAARLYDRQGKTILPNNVYELFIHAIKFLFPATLGSPGRGLPTAWAHPIFGDIVTNGEFLPVWLHVEGKVYGTSVEPLYQSVPSIVLGNEKAHAIFAAIDALRLGRSRETRIAIEYLRGILVP